MRLLLSCVLVVTLLCAAVLVAAEPEVRLPGITRSTNNVYLIENHSTDFNIWHSRNIKGATLVHLDAHDDCRYVPPAKLETLNGLVVARKYQEIFDRSDLESSFQYRIRPSDFLFDLGNYIYPCIVDGTVSRFYWVVPDKTLSTGSRELLESHIQLALNMPTLEIIKRTEHSFSFPLSNAVITITTLDDLPTVEPGAVLDMDTDFFVFPEALSETHVMHHLPWDPAVVCEMLSQKVPAPGIVTVCSSVSGGYLPVAFRFISDGCYDYFASGRYPDDARALLQVVSSMMSSLTPVAAPPRPADKVFQPACEHIQGLSLISQGQDAGGIECLERAANLQPVYAKALLDMVDAFISMAKLSRAHDMIDRYEKRSGGETSQSAAMRVRVYLAQREFDKADDLSRKLVDWDRTPYFLMLRGGVLVEQGNVSAAKDIYRETIRLHPRDSSSYYNMGVLLTREGRKEEAMEYYEAALQRKADLASANENLGHLLLGQGKSLEAIGHLKAAALANPFSIATLNNLGLALARQKLAAEAIDCYKAALRLDPGRAEVHANLAAALIETGKIDEGLAECREALRLKPGWPEVIGLMEQAKGVQRERLPAQELHGR